MTQEKDNFIFLNARKLTGEQKGSLKEISGPSRGGETTETTTELQNGRKVRTAHNSVVNPGPVGSTDLDLL
jgi:hypothetical protein